MLENIHEPCFQVVRFVPKGGMSFQRFTIRKGILLRISTKIRKMSSQVCLPYRSTASSLLQCVEKARDVNIDRRSRANLTSLLQVCTLDGMASDERGINSLGKAV